MFVLSKQSALAATSTSLFVLLWSSGAIFSKWGLAHASPFAFLLIRFAIALCGLVLLAPLLKLKLPKGGKPMLFAIATGLVLLGAYQIFYLLALEALIKREDRTVYKALSADEALSLLLQHEFAMAILTCRCPA